MFDNPVFVVILLVVVAALGAAAGFFAGRSKGQEMARDAKTADLNEAKAQIEADRRHVVVLYRSHELNTLGRSSRSSNGRTTQQ